MRAANGELLLLLPAEDEEIAFDGDELEGVCCLEMDSCEWVVVKRFLLWCIGSCIFIERQVSSMTPSLESF